MKKIIALVILLAACDALRGPKGEPGQPGETGKSGHNSLISIVNSAPTCLNGGSVVLSGNDFNDNNVLESSEVSASTAICNGIDGTAGTNGIDGSNGRNALVALIAQAQGGGASCSTGGITIITGIDANSDGILQPVEAEYSKDVCNGLTGAQGVTGAAGINGAGAPSSPYDTVGIVDPCGAQTSWDEVFLRLRNGLLVASFSSNVNGDNTRFSILRAGNYLTTDQTGCYFSVDIFGQIYNEHN